MVTLKSEGKSVFHADSFCHARVVALKTLWKTPTSSSFCIYLQSELYISVMTNHIHMNAKSDTRTNE